MTQVSKSIHHSEHLSSSCAVVALSVIKNCEIEGNRSFDTVNLLAEDNSDSYAGSIILCPGCTVALELGS